MRLQKRSWNEGHLVTKIDPSEKQFHQTDWNHFDVAFIALHGSYGEDGQVQALLNEKTGSLHRQQRGSITIGVR